MYKRKIGILYVTNEGKKIWTVHYEDWDTDYDVDDMLDDIYREEQAKCEGTDKVPHHVVTLGVFDCEDGAFFCGSCECYFERCDPDIGENCCPYCGDKNFKKAEDED
jgi:hypothetical protein